MSGAAPATLTMLFSDIEGSTTLVSRLGDRYGDALSAHRVLLREQFATWRGRELSTEGDSFFVVFESASDAVNCCAAAQRALAGHDWPHAEPIRVRMGLHSGEPTPHEDNYIGIDVHRAARIAATAHGGQVVLSEVAWLLARSRVLDGVSVRDLGFHRLKDIAAPERIYQLMVPGLREEFPPLKSLGAQTNLPVPVTPLIGRDGELARVRTVFAQEGARLLTLTGTGGVGKTRLAIEAADALSAGFPHGVFFVALAAVRDADVMWKVLADSLDVAVEGQAGDAVRDYLGRRRALLVLDNLEQLDGAGQVVAALLAAAPSLVVLATSRGLLHVQGEHELPVPALELPRAGASSVPASAAAQLFARQAGMVRPGFAITADNAADIADICRRLDGLPLAIELVASRARLLAPKALLARLADGAALGQGAALGAAEAGRPLRQQTLRNTVSWSYDLLSPELAEAFRRMSVFAGGCDLDALTAVAAPGEYDPLELVTELQDVSLVTVSEGADGEPRLGMLETIRQYALERLEQDDDLDGVRRRHAEHYMAFAERAREQMYGPAQLTVMDRVEADYDNLRAALAWSLEPSGDDRAIIGLRTTQALMSFWYMHGHAAEGRRWLERAFDLAAADGGAPLARVANGLGVLLDQQGEPETARRMFERSLAIWRELGDREQEARQLNSLGIVYRHLGEPERARELFEQAIAINREAGITHRLGASLANLGQLESAAGNYDRAYQVVREALALDLRYGDPFGQAVDRHTLALLSVRAGRPREARELLRELTGYIASSGNTSLLANTLEVAALIAVALGEAQQAGLLIGAADAIREESSMPLTEPEAEMLEEWLAPARAAATAEDWAAALAAGRGLSQQEVFALLAG
jgi:predicted ATPase/class 3 adenylate cyclase